MEIDIKSVHFGADVYDVCKAVELVLHSSDFYDPNDPRNKGRKPNFEVELRESPAGRIHDGTGVLRVPDRVGNQLLEWLKSSDKNKIILKGRTLRLFRTPRRVSPPVKQRLEKALYVGPEKEKQRKSIESQARGARLRLARVQFGMWHRPPNSPPNQKRAFSIEYERDFLSKSEAYIYVVYEHKLIRIDIGQRETEEINYMILIKFKTICKLGVGRDEFGQSFVIFDLYTPPVFEGKSFNTWEPGTKQRRGYKPRDRLLALDDAHARIAPYAHHLRVTLRDPDDLATFVEICRLAECEPRPVRAPRLDAQSLQLLSRRNLFNVGRWIEKMEWKTAFQIEAYLRRGLLNPRDLLEDLRGAIEGVTRDYGTEASEFLRLFSSELRKRSMDEAPGACLARFREKHPPTWKPLQLPPGNVSCHHVIITPSRMLLEGPIAVQSNRVIRHYHNHDPSLVERFLRVTFCDEDRLAYRWDRDVDVEWFLQRCVGGVLRDGLEVAGRSFQFLAYSTSSLREHTVWFVSPFRDPEEGLVDAGIIRAQLGDFSQLLRTPSKYAARIAQAFTSTDPSVKLRRGQWEEQPDLGPHTDGVGTISKELADMIWKEKCRASGHLRKRRVEPSAYQFRFLGYKGVVVVDSQLKGIKMRLRPSQCKFPTHDVEEAEFEIARSFDFPTSTHLNRPVIMILEDRGVKKEAFINLQDVVKARIYLSKTSLENFKCLLKDHSLGSKYHLSFILEQLYTLGLDFKDSREKRAIRNVFFERLLRYSMSHSLRQVKFKARIPVPRSYQLVGVADEGQAYIQEGADPDDVFTLKEGRIYACVQGPTDEDPIYLKGTCVISRSPVMHPGDVQRVFAVGEPPADKKCFFRGLKNVVVLPAVGVRSLASGLAGGDLDGDTYDVYYDNPALLPTIQKEAAEYPPGEIWTLDEDRGDATIEDICHFIVEYIHSDVMGLLADRHLLIADQSKDGVFDNQCLKLAKLYSKAVDYAKNGTPVDISTDFPRPLIEYKPDWKKEEVTGAREHDYYESDRALGHLFRKIDPHEVDEPLEDLSNIPPEVTAPLEDMISRTIAPLIQTTLNIGFQASEAESAKTKGLYMHYVGEMRYVCTTHTLLDTPDVRLAEEEVVLGTILAKSTQPRLRSDRTNRMQVHAEALVRDVRAQMAPTGDQPTVEEYRDGLRSAWAMWSWAQHHRNNEFIESFSLIALGVILDCLQQLGALPIV